MGLDHLDLNPIHNMTPDLKASIIIPIRIKNQLNHAKDEMVYLLGIKGDEINGNRDERQYPTLIPLCLG
jgi:hypothetical protein